MKNCLILTLCCFILISKVEAQDMDSTIYNSTPVSYLWDSNEVFIPMCCFCFPTTDFDSEPEPDNATKIIAENNCMQLFNNYPNPVADAGTTFKIKLKENIEGVITIRIFDGLGNEVTKLKSAGIVSGLYRPTWNASIRSGHRAPTGQYYYQVNVSNCVATSKMMVLGENRRNVEIRRKVFSSQYQH